MKLSLPESDKAALLDQLGTANLKFQKTYPGDRPDRQPVHTVYGGANLFKADTCVRMGDIALNNLLTYAPNFVELARVLRAERPRAPAAPRSRRGRPHRQARRDEPRGPQAGARLAGLLGVQQDCGEAEARGRGRLPHRLRGRLRQPARCRGGRHRRARRPGSGQGHDSRARCRRSSASASSPSPKT